MVKHTMRPNIYIMPFKSPLKIDDKAKYETITNGDSCKNK